MNGARPDDGGGGASARAGYRHDVLIATYTLLWALCFVGASYLIKHGMVSGGVLAWLVAALPSLAAVWMVVAYTRYLRAADELERLIQLQAMGWGFGGGFFVICGYMLFEQLGAPAVDDATLAAVMPVLFALGVLVGKWRYR